MNVSSSARASLECPSPTRLGISHIATPLGTMVAVGDEAALYFLEFSDWHGLEPMLQRLQAKTQLSFVPTVTPVLALIQTELESYFAGTLKEFKTPLAPLGTAFQLRAWEALQRIPYGTTQSYRDQAFDVGNPLGYRAVARANATNPIGIVIPCHRVINHNGELGGYGGGLDRKKWLLAHEKAFCKDS